MSGLGTDKGSSSCTGSGVGLQHPIERSSRAVAKYTITKMEVYIHLYDLCALGLPVYICIPFFGSACVCIFDSERE